MRLLAGVPTSISRIGLGSRVSLSNTRITPASYCICHPAVPSPIPLKPRTFIPSLQVCARLMSSTTTPAASHPPSLATKDVLFSCDANPTILSKDLEPLLRSGGGRWQLTAQRNGLERSFKFKSFKKTWVIAPLHTVPRPLHHLTIPTSLIYANFRPKRLAIRASWSS